MTEAVTDTAEASRRAVMVQRIRALATTVRADFSGKTADHVALGLEAFADAIADRRRVAFTALAEGEVVPKDAMDAALMERDIARELAESTQRDQRRQFEELQAAREERDRLRAALEKATGRRFPVLEGGPLSPSSVPWAALHHHEGQALKNHEQTLERLAERGGLAPCEIVAIMEGRKWHRMDHAEAVRRMVELTALALRSLVAPAPGETPAPIPGKEGPR